MLSLYFLQVDYPEIAEGVVPRHRFMSAYEQKVRHFLKCFLQWKIQMVFPLGGKLISLFKYTPPPQLLPPPSPHPPLPPPPLPVAELVFFFVF
jgi:hypothetical protein